MNLSLQQIFPNADSQFCRGESELYKEPNVSILPALLLLPLTNKYSTEPSCIAFNFFLLFDSDVTIIRIPCLSSFAVFCAHHLGGICKLRADRSELIINQSLLIMIVAIHNIANELTPVALLPVEKCLISSQEGSIVPELLEYMHVLLN